MSLLHCWGIFMFMAVSGKKAKGLKIVGEFKSHYVEECDILISYDTELGDNPQIHDLTAFWLCYTINVIQGGLMFFAEALAYENS